jgi:hypothetical protein
MFFKNGAMKDSWNNSHKKNDFDTNSKYMGWYGNNSL